MNNISGKFTFKGFMVLAILGIGAYIGISFVSNTMTKNAIETKIKDSIGFIMGEGRFTESEKASAYARTIRILKEYHAEGTIIFTKKDENLIRIEFNEHKQKVTYYFQYTIKLNYLIDEKVELMKVSGAM